MSLNSRLKCIFHQAAQKQNKIESLYVNAVLILRDGITALERIRSIPEIALPPNMDPALLYLDPSLKRPEVSVPIV